MKVVRIDEIKKRSNERYWKWSEFVDEISKKLKDNTALEFSIKELRTKLNVPPEKLNDKRFLENVRTRARRTKINNRQLKVSTKKEKNTTHVYFYLE